MKILKRAVQNTESSAAQYMGRSIPSAEAAG